ncbi:MAG: SMC-Scp complex subunit ScpB [Acidobacteriota bacterium]|nr:SMC-Scp complex subunit ScpB [Acidobacteriota bacterium]
MTNEERKAALEAIIYAADEPATIDQLAVALGDEKLAVQSSLDELVASYANDDHGIEIREVAGGFKLYTKPQQHDVVRRFIKSLRPPLRLTMPALETLAVISYKQPVTGPEIGEIRGVNTSGVLKTLLDKRLITTAGRKEVIGRPILYRTSKEFLMRFGLSDLGELPSLKEFEALAREALGSDEGVAVPDELPTDLLDEVLDSPENVAASAAAAETGHDRTDPFVEAFASKLQGGTMTSDKIPANRPADEEVAAEVTATNEGMPAGEIDEAPKDSRAVQAPEAFDEEKSRKDRSGEFKGAAAGE